MSNTKHTPGPWRISTANPCEVNAGKGAESMGVASAHNYDIEGIFCPPTQAQANARLIAAAPELLEALLWIMDHRENCDIPSPEGSWDEQARAAIAKATQP